ncbi:MAG: transposase [Bryobacteraceae bacterium]|nr:transposase [Bryobacteraceae bacterium]
MKTSKSPRAVLMTAYHVGQARLPDYSHPCGPKTYTQPQLFACLVFKEFMRLDYRKLSACLKDTPELAKTIALDPIPHFSTFQKAARRLLSAHRVDRLLSETVKRAVRAGVMKKRVRRAAIDGTGFETRHISSYYVRRRAKACKTGYQTTTYTRFPCANVVCDCASHFILAVITGRGPGPDDPYLRPALKQTLRRTSVDLLLADAGFDSEAAHQFAREECGMRTLIPPTRGRPTKKPPQGRWRRVMAKRFDKRKYGQRWQVETVNSMIKRLLDSALRARRYWNQHRAIILRVLTHNIMILRWRVFYRAFLTPFPIPFPNFVWIVGRGGSHWI